MARVTVLLAVLVAGVSQGAAPSRILFIGNSLTYANDLPAMVCALARAAGRTAVCEAVVRPDFSLEDHWNQGEARQAIARGWDVVVLQQGPSALPESRALLVGYTKRFDAEIRKAGARTALYMVWPSRQRRGDFPGVSRSYGAAASAVGGILVPAGDAWREAWKLDAALALYGPDGFHPSVLGSHLAALTVYRQLFGVPAPPAAVAGVGDEDARVLRQAVESAVGGGRRFVQPRR